MLTVRPGDGVISIPIGIGDCVNSVCQIHVRVTLVVARVSQRTQGAHKGRPNEPITYQIDTGSRYRHTCDLELTCL